MDVKILMVNSTASAAKQALSNIVIGLAAFFAASTTASGLARSLNISSVVGVSFGGCSGAVGGSGSPDRRLRRGAAIRGFRTGAENGIEGFTDIFRSVRPGRRSRTIRTVVHLRLGKLFVSGTVHVNITQAHVACSGLTTLRMRIFSLLLIGAGAGAFDRSRVSWKNESRGIYYSYTAEDGSKTKISPWHDIPFTLGKDDGGAMLLSFVCEIPRNSRPKIEIHKSEPYNPLLQDVKKDGSLRYYMYSDSLVKDRKSVV
jgi:hypothetical protein